MPTIAFHSAKGGAGCTTVATLFALQIHRGNNPVHLSFAGDRQQMDDAVTTLGMPGVNDYAIQGVAPGFTMGVTRNHPAGTCADCTNPDEVPLVHVVDVGTRHSAESWAAEVAVVLVIRNDYLSLHRVLGVPGFPRERFDGIVLLEDPSWPLGNGDVSEALGLPVLEVFQTDARLQRWIDSGGLGSRPRHPHFFHHLDRLVGVRP